MIIKFIECGKIVNTHGIKGEVKINPWCDSPEFLAKFKILYLDKNGSSYLNVEKSRAANNVVITKFENINSVEDAEKIRDTIVYIKRDDAGLNGRHFVQELKGCNVYHADNNELLGIVTDIIQLPANDVWQITKDDKDYLLPAIDDVIISVDVENEKVVINPMKGIFDDEN